MTCESGAWFPAHMVHEMASAKVQAYKRRAGAERQNLVESYKTARNIPCFWRRNTEEEAKKCVETYHREHWALPAVPYELKRLLALSELAMTAGSGDGQKVFVTASDARWIE